MKNILHSWDFAHPVILKSSPTVEYNRKFTFKLFNQGDAFDFYVNCRPCLENNILCKILYASFVSEILHIVRITKDLIKIRIGIRNKAALANTILTRLKKQEFESSHNISFLKKMFRKQSVMCHKFPDTADMCMYIFIYIIICLFYTNFSLYVLYIVYVFYIYIYISTSCAD